MTTKKFVQAEELPKQLSRNLFQEDWWLDIATDGRWNKLSVATGLGTVHLIFGLRSRYGALKEIYAPPLSPYNGLYIDANRTLTRSEQYNLLGTAIPNLIEQLPRHGRFKLNMSPEFEWWSPFYWAGFNQHTRYTYLLNNIKDHEQCWSGFNSNTKRNIRKAGKKITVSSCSDTSTLYSLFSKTMKHQGIQPGYPPSLVENLYEEIKRRNVGTVLTGHDEQGNAHCSLLLVWDDHYGYYLSGGTDPDLRSSGAMPLLMWHAIKHASQFVDTYNFEGSMQKGIDQFLRGFGGIATPYYSIGKGLLSGKIT